MSEPHSPIHKNNTQRIFYSQYPLYIEFEQSGAMEKHERLRQARIDAGFRFASHAADSLGVKRPTYAHHENGTRVFGADEARLYARRFKVSAEWLLYGVGDQKKVTAGDLEPTDTQFTPIPIRGEVAAGLWREYDELSQDLGEPTEYAPTVVLEGYPKEQQFALRVRGESLNKIAPDGSILHCLEYINGDAWNIKDGDLVVVQRSKYQGAMIETTAKRVRKVGETYELWPESNHPDFQEPLIVPEVHDAESAQEIRIFAKVLRIIIEP